jgi:hypothetical protein
VVACARSGTHWNTYDSVFMAPCVGIAPACGGGELWVPAPPAATVAPVISGPARRGTAMRSGQGTWINRPDSYVYTWERLAGGRWSPIADADQAGYMPTAKDLGRRLRVTVAAANADGTTASTSMATSPIGAVAIIRANSSRHKRHRLKA